MPEYEDRIPHTARGCSTNFYQSLLGSSDESETGNTTNRFHLSDESRRTLFSAQPLKNKDQSNKPNTIGTKSASRPVINVNPFSPFVSRSKSVISPCTHRSTEIAGHTITDESIECMKRDKSPLSQSSSLYDLNQGFGQSLVLNAITHSSPHEEIRPRNSADLFSFIRCLESDYIEPFSARRSEASQVDDMQETFQCSQCSPRDSSHSRTLQTCQNGSPVCLRSQSMPETMSHTPVLKYSTRKRSQTPKPSTFSAQDLSPTRAFLFYENDVNEYTLSKFTPKLAELENALCVRTDDTTYQIFFFTSHSKGPLPIPVHRDVNGMVWLVKSALDGQAYFLKEIECDSFRAAQRMLFWEIQCLQVSETCDFITSLHKYWWDPDHRACFLLTECCAGGLVPQYIQRANCTETAVYEVVCGALQAMKSLHAHGLIHGNCHIYNFHIVPVMLHSSEAVYSTIKLGNFGSSKSDLSVQHRHTANLPEELCDCSPEESFHSELSFDDVYRFGNSLLEFVGEETVRKFRNPLRRVIFRMAGLVDVMPTMPSELQVRKPLKRHALKSNAFSAAELLHELNKRKHSHMTYLQRIELLNKCKGMENKETHLQASFLPRSGHSAHSQMVLSPSQRYVEHKDESVSNMRMSLMSSASVCMTCNEMDSINKEIERLMPNNVKALPWPTLPILAAAFDVHSA